MKYVEDEDGGGFERRTNRKTVQKALRRMDVDSVTNGSDEDISKSTIAGKRPAVPSEVEVGHVLNISNGVWKILAPNSQDHPGVCCASETGKGIPFLQGTGFKIEWKYRPGVLIINPDANNKNGLTKPTMFKGDRFHSLPFNSIKNYYCGPRFMGAFDNTDRSRLIEFVRRMAWFPDLDAI